MLEDMDDELNNMAPGLITDANFGEEEGDEQLADNLDNLNDPPENEMDMEFDRDSNDEVDEDLFNDVQDIPNVKSKA